MRQLHSGSAALPMNEAHDSRQHLNVIVLPDAQILRADPPLRQYRRGLGEHQSRSAHGAASQMHQVPVVRISIVARVFAHRRNKRAIGKRNITNRQRIEQMSHNFYTTSANGSPTNHSLGKLERCLGLVSAKRIVRLLHRDLLAYQCQRNLQRFVGADLDIRFNSRAVPIVRGVRIDRPHFNSSNIEIISDSMKIRGVISSGGGFPD